jgi:flagellar basal body-associated protein FliL
MAIENPQKKQRKKKTIQLISLYSVYHIFFHVHSLSVFIFYDNHGTNSENEATETGSPH